jgi:hypothetical protein
MEKEMTNWSADHELSDPWNERRNGSGVSTGVQLSGAPLKPTASNIDDPDLATRLGRRPYTKMICL